MIPLIRNHKTQFEKLADSHLVIDLLKWNVISPGNVSRWGRMMARLFTKADSEYKNPVPPELT
jgi:hypothetical protein